MINDGTECGVVRNVLGVMVESVETPTVSGRRSVALAVDGRRLEVLAAEVEGDGIEKYPDDPLFGRLPMAVHEVRGPEHYMGDSAVGCPGEAPGEPNRTVLLGCCCGTWECAPISAVVEVDDDEVRWSRFWNFREALPELGPFVFDRMAYEAAFAEIDWDDTGIPAGGWGVQ